MDGDKETGGNVPPFFCDRTRPSIKQLHAGARAGTGIKSETSGAVAGRDPPCADCSSVSCIAACCEMTGSSLSLTEPLGPQNDIRAKYIDIAFDLHQPKNLRICFEIVPSIISYERRQMVRGHRRQRRQRQQRERLVNHVHNLLLHSLTRRRHNFIATFIDMQATNLYILHTQQCWIDIPDGENPEFLMKCKTLHLLAEISDGSQLRQYRGLSRSAMPWGWMMKKSNTTENGAFVSVRKFEGPLAGCGKT
ncbi:hypothetical protein JOB18_034218 [Solea senegalensis]|uniref:Uncharacterized protein n=1 Tax=Solea senegalensis TaxID=28829 RepID=A0AAV6SBW3_SOLSE|nr:hypothetical protein JOB18_034218 [Solea senegalensis]